MRYLLLPLLAICSPCWGQSEYVQSDLIDGPKAVAVGELFKVKIKGDLPYKVDPEPVSIDELLDRKGNLLLLIVSSESGELKITVDYRVVHPTEEEIEKAPWDDRAAFAKWLKESSQDELYSDSHTVKVGKGPDPEPDPDPDPKPDPKPDGPYWVIVLEETGERTPETAKILADTAFLKSLTDAGHKWRTYDEDHADAKSFAALTTHRPALIVLTLSGEVVHTVPMPKTAAEITELLKGGK